MRRARRKLRPFTQEQQNAFWNVIRDIIGKGPIPYTAESKEENEAVHAPLRYGRGIPVHREYAP